VAESFAGTRVVEGIPVTSRGDQDYLVVKYSTNGEFRWVETAGGEGADVPRALAINGQGSVLIGGSLTGIGTFGSITVGSNAPAQAVVAKLSDAAKPHLTLNFVEPLRADVRLTLTSGYTGRLHHVERSRDLSFWSAYGTLTNLTGSAEALIPANKLSPSNFLRVRVAP
jgi:hypothetical protein